jgi:DNA-binding NtrC family response regulator
VLASAGPLFGAPSAVAPERAAAPERSGEGSAPVGARLVEALSRFPIELPPLRERAEDVGPIAESIVRRLSRVMSRPVALTPEAVALLAGRRWRGNVRQLERLLERAVAFTTSGEIDASALVELVDEVENGLGSIRRQRAHQEREALVATLRRTGGNVSRTATLLGRSRGAVYRLMAKHGLTAGGSP